MAHRVLVVDDEERMRGLLVLYLKRAFEVVETAASGDEALEKLASSHYDLVILDILMPGVDGWEVCRRIREKSRTPVMMLTALSETEDKLEAFGAGADDYLTKPFDPRELVARAQALVRRAHGGERLAYGPLVIDLLARQVFVEGKPVSLTPKEFDLLAWLVRSPGRAFSREELLHEVWGETVFLETRTIDSHVKTLREKLGRDKAGAGLVTVWGVGYKFDPEAIGRGR